MIQSQKKRIEWIDMAKAFAILTVIMGHTTPFDTVPRNFIFSFHMPLFFILSGYTFRYAKDWKEAGRQTWKDFKLLIIPTVGLFIFASVLSVFLEHRLGNVDWTHEISVMVQRLYYSSGVEVYGVRPIGMLWFLISLFTARLLLRLIGLLFQGNGIELIGISLGFCGILMGEEKRFLPFNFDVSLVALFFIVVGVLIKRYWEMLESKRWLVYASGAIWASTFGFHIYIELARRYYPYMGVSLIESIAASYLVVQLSQAISTNAVILSFGKFFGKHTLLILYVHYMDYLWYRLWNHGGFYKQSALRIVLDLAIAALIVGARTLLRNTLHKK